MNLFAGELLAVLDVTSTQVAAWCLLPNHYHLLAETVDLKAVTRALGQLHGRSSRIWNIEDQKPGRKIFHRSADRRLRSEAHIWATLNYIHHNPVRHGYVPRWTDWPWSSAHDYLHSIGATEAARMWHAYPVLDYGEGWDDPNV